MNKIKLKCRRPGCNNFGERYPSQIRSKNGLYCSKNCRYIHQKETIKGVNNPNYKNGKFCNVIKCKCGKEKDYRSKFCAECSRKGYPKDKNYTVCDSLIIEHIKNSSSILEVSKNLKISRKRIARIILNYNLDVSHFVKCNTRPYDENILNIGDRRRNNTVKRIIIKNNLIKYECQICKQNNEWFEKILNLELDHINGNPVDNRIENLRFLCPNCHSQTETYRGKNMKGKVI